MFGPEDGYSEDEIMAAEIQTWWKHWKPEDKKRFMELFVEITGVKNWKKFARRQ